MSSIFLIIYHIEFAKKYIVSKFVNIQYIVIKSFSLSYRNFDSLFMRATDETGIISRFISRFLKIILLQTFKKIN